MSVRHKTPVEAEACAVCRGPAQHPGRCADLDGNVLPAYEALARMGEAPNFKPISFEEIGDIEQVLEQWDDQQAGAGMAHL